MPRPPPGSGRLRVITASCLVNGVLEDPGQRRHSVLDAAGRAGQVDDQRGPGQAGQAAGQHGGRDSGRFALPPEGLRDAGYLAVQDPPGHLRGEVGRRQPGPAGGDHDGVPGLHRPPQRRLDRRAVGDDLRAVDLAPGLAQQPGQDRPGPVGVDPGGGPGGDRDGQRPGHAAARPRQVPVLPPVFSSTMTSVITAAGSTALIMSISASAATETAVSASISTPVRSAVRAVAVIVTPSSSTTMSIVTECSPIGWQSGIRSGVRLAPWMPAILATASASPLGTVPSRSAATAAADSSTRPDAVATRAVTSLADTSTMRACPTASRWVRSRAAPGPPASAAAPGPPAPAGTPAPWLVTGGPARRRRFPRPVRPALRAR